MHKKTSLIAFLILSLAIVFSGCDCGTETSPESEAEPMVLLTSEASSAVVGEVIEAELGVKAIGELAAIGVTLSFDIYKLEVVQLSREDEWLTSNDGTIQQMEFSTDEENGITKIVLAIFPRNESTVVGDESETFHSIASLRIRTLSAGNATMTVSIDNTADSDLGIFDANANLVSGIGTENLTISVSSSK